MDVLYKVFVDPFVQMGGAPDLLVQTVWEGSWRACSIR
jgi:branched-chain amino acid transport system permease protein